MFPVGLFLSVKIEGCQTLIRRFYQESINNVLGVLNPHPIFEQDEIYKIFVTWTRKNQEIKFKDEYIDIDLHVDVEMDESTETLHPFKQDKHKFEYIKISDLNKSGVQLTISRSKVYKIGLTIYLYNWSETFKDINAIVNIYGNR